MKTVLIDCFLFAGLALVCFSLGAKFNQPAKAAPARLNFCRCPGGCLCDQSEGCECILRN